MQETILRRRRSLLAAAGVLCGGLLVAAPAGAATSASGLYVDGAGSGHGIGMSQYGAAGYALHGESYRQILGDYYAHTTIGHVDPKRPVTVLLRARGAAAFTGATRIEGAKQKLDPTADYSVLPAGGRLRLVSRGHRVGIFGAPLQVVGDGPVTLLGQGSYRGVLAFRPAPGGRGVMTVNSVGLDDYVRGVVAAEMPRSWPQQALEAQAVAARSYAIASHPAAADFEVYDTTRSQMYQGVAAETPETDAAVAATSGQVVEYAGLPVVTYFFASSGGQTESVQNVFPVAPEPWLVSRPDPYDDAFNNPYHRWRMSFSLAAAAARLGRLVEGSLRGIRILRHGVSPRIVTARVIGTRGGVDVSGTQLRKDLGTPSDWMSFTTVTAHGVLTSTTPGSDTSTTTTGTESTTTGSSGGGGLTGRVARASPLHANGRATASRYGVRGSVFPARPGAGISIEAGGGSHWRVVARGTVASNGSYSVAVAGPGGYRVLYHGITGPQITVR